MGESSLARGSATVATASGSPAAVTAGRAGIWTTLEDFDAQELRLYALGWGDHLPSEVLERIDALRRRKLALEVQLELHHCRVYAGSVLYLADDG